jgi:protein translocase SecG subunit
MNPLLLAVAAGAQALPTVLATALPHGAAARPPAGVPTGAPAAPPPLPPQPAPTTWFQAHLPWLTHGIAGLFVISAILLIFLLAIQTTKQEGLTGSIGGRVESSYRGRLGTEEMLKVWTGRVAVAFVICGFVLSLTGI